MEVLALLKAEIAALKKIFNVTLALFQISNHEEFISTLPAHQKKRNHLFQGYVLFEEKIITELKKLSSEKKSTLKPQLMTLLREKETKIASLLKLDNQLMSKIEQVQQSLDQKLAESKKARTQLTRFMSQSETQSGKSLDVKL